LSTTPPRGRQFSTRFSYSSLEERVHTFPSSQTLQSCRRRPCRVGEVGDPGGSLTTWWKTPCPIRLMSEVLTQHPGLKVGLTQTALGNGKSCARSVQKSCPVPTVYQIILGSFARNLETLQAVEINSAASRSQLQGEPGREPCCPP
jgi:hypothetical protein